MDKKAQTKFAQMVESGHGVMDAWLKAEEGSSIRTAQAKKAQKGGLRVSLKDLVARRTN